MRVRCKKCLATYSQVRMKELYIPSQTASLIGRQRRLDLCKPCYRILQSDNKWDFAVKLGEKY